MTILDIIWYVVFVLSWGGLMGYMGYLSITSHNLRLGRWKNGVGGLYFWSSDNNGIDIFFIPMRENEIECSDDNPEEWLAEQRKLKWRIRRVHIAWLPWYLFQDLGPEKFCEGLMNYFDEEDNYDEP